MTSRFTPALRRSYSGSTLTKVTATLVSGVAIGITAAALQLAVDEAARQRNALLGSLLDAGGLPRFFAALLCISLAAVLAATAAVHLLAPRAAGGGVALVMAYLNGAWGRCRVLGHCGVRCRLLPLLLHVRAVAAATAAGRRPFRLPTPAPAAASAAPVPQATPSAACCLAQCTPSSWRARRRRAWRGWPSA